MGILSSSLCQWDRNGWKHSRVPECNDKGVFWIGYVKDLDRSADVIKGLQGLDLPASGNIEKSLESEF